MKSRFFCINISKTDKRVYKKAVPLHRKNNQKLSKQ